MRKGRNVRALEPEPPPLQMIDNRADCWDADLRKKVPEQWREKLDVSFQPGKRRAFESDNKARTRAFNEDHDTMVYHVLRLSHSKHPLGMYVDNIFMALTTYRRNGHKSFWAFQPEPPVSLPEVATALRSLEIRGLVERIELGSPIRVDRQEKPEYFPKAQIAGNMVSHTTWRAKRTMEGVRIDPQAAKPSAKRKPDEETHGKKISKRKGNV